MNLKAKLHLKDLNELLNEKLTNSFRPHIDEIPDIKSKGIYF
jgi:hypothetical protein